MNCSCHYLLEKPDEIVLIWKETLVHYPLLLEVAFLEYVMVKELL